MRTLIVYYSLEGNTEYAAKRIARMTDADLLRLVPKKPYRKGPAKYIRGGKGAIMAEAPELEEYDVDFAKYDRIVIGFPVWASNVAPPIRTFVRENRARLGRKDIVAFACQGGRGAEKALAKLKKAIGIDEFDQEAVFNDPKSKRSREKDRMIDSFGGLLAEQAAEVEEEETRDLLRTTARAVLGKATGAAVAKIMPGKQHRPAEDDRPQKKNRPAKEDRPQEQSRPRKIAKAVTKVPRKKAKSFVFHWTYGKHAKVCVAAHLAMFAFDMTVSYIILKKLLDRADEALG